MNPLPRGATRRAIMLAQVLVVLALLAVVLPGLLDLLFSGDRDIHHSAALSRAVDTAQVLLERVTETSFLEAHRGRRLHLTGTDTAGLIAGGDFFRIDHGQAVVEVTTAPDQTNPATGGAETELVEVWVEVRWQEAGRERGYRLVSRRALLGEVER